MARQITLKHIRKAGAFAAEDLAAGEVGVDTSTPRLNYSPDGTVIVGVANLLVEINAQTGTTYTLALSDIAKLVTLSNGSAITLTVPANSSVAFPVGTAIALQQLGAGQVTISPAGGVTVQGTGTKLRLQYSGASLVKRGTDTWSLVGDLTT